MKQGNVVVRVLIGCIIFAIVLAANTLFLTSKYGQTLRNIDSQVRWEFFHEQLLTNEQAAELYGQGDIVNSLPHRFEEHYGTAQTYGSYVTRFQVPAQYVGERAAFYVPYEFGSYELYVDGQLVMKNGRVGTTKEEQVPRHAPVIGQMTVEQSEVLIVLHLSNFYSVRGGLAQSIQFGEPENIIAQHNSNIIVYFFINGIIFVIGLYMLLFGVFNKRDVPTLLLAVFAFVISVRSLFTRPYLYAITIFNVPWEYAIKIEMICTLLSTSLAISFCYYWFKTKLSRHLLKVVYSLGFVQTILVLFTTPLLFQKTFVYLYGISLLTFSYILFVAFRNFRQLKSLELFQFIGMTIVFSCAAHDFVVVHLMLEWPVLVQISVVCFMTVQVSIMSWQYAQQLQETVKLNKAVMELNATLDEKIKARTEQLEEVNAQLEILASRDALTGIGNRHTFDERLLFYFDYAKAHDSSISLLLIDLDNFKKYNDYYGHTMGDVILKRVVEVIAETLPSEAVFTRYGGEEFAVILPQIEKRELLFLGNELVQTVANQRFEHMGCDNQIVTISVGGYTMTAEQPFTYTKELIDAADEQLYLAKRFGKNMCVTT